MFFSYHQNNSGGYYTGPAQVVCVECDNSIDTDNIAEANGLYFSGLGDCACCGRRWSKAWDANMTEQPEAYGSPIAESGCSYVIIYKDGRVERSVDEAEPTKITVKVKVNYNDD